MSEARENVTSLTDGDDTSRLAPPPDCSEMPRPTPNWSESHLIQSACPSTLDSPLISVLNLMRITAASWCGRGPAARPLGCSGSHADRGRGRRGMQVREGP